MIFFRSSLIPIAAGLFVVWSTASLAAPLPSMNAPSATQVQGQAEKAVRARQKTQELVEGFAAKEARLLDEIEALERELKSARRQRSKTEAYAAGQKAKVDELSRRVKEMELIRSELEPYLDESLKRLSQLVSQDLPFLPQERAARLASVKQTLDNYDATLAQKIHRLLETLAIEARYGSTVETKEAELQIKGVSLRVKLFRLGRLGLFALDLDGHESWRFDPATKEFIPINQYTRQLNQAADIAARRRVISLVEIPVGRPPRKAGQP